MLKITKEEFSKLNPQEMQNIVKGINKKINKYETAIYLYKSALGDLYEELRDIRTRCPHTNTTVINRPYTVDSHYECYTCEDCGEEWRKWIIDKDWGKNYAEDRTDK